jgi:hypothetical protein
MFLFTWDSKCLVQRRVIDLMQRERLTGFWTKPAKAAMERAGEEIPVQQFCVSGWGGIASRKSGIRMDESCPGCLWTDWSGLRNPEALIEPANWDGSDFFMIWPMPAFIFASARAYAFFREHKITGARFSKTSPEGGAEIGFSPERLFGWMPDDKAHAIGDPPGRLLARSAPIAVAG